MTRNATETPSEEPAPRRKRGRPKGLGKVPGSGRKKREYTQAEMRGFIYEETKGFAHLIKLANNEKVQQSGVTGKTFLGHPPPAMSLRACEAILNKVVPDLSNMALTGADNDGPIEVEADTLPEGNRNLARVVLNILGSAKIDEADGQIIHDERTSKMSALGQKQTFGRALRMSALPPRADILRGDVYVRVRDQRPWNRLRPLLKGVFLAHRHQSGVNDETQNRAASRCGRTHCQRHSAQDAEACACWRRRPSRLAIFTSYV